MLYCLNTMEPSCTHGAACHGIHDVTACNKRTCQQAGQGAALDKCKLPLKGVLTASLNGELQAPPTESEKCHHLS